MSLNLNKLTSKEKTRKIVSSKYEGEIEPIRVNIDKYQDLNISVKRMGKYGLPRLDIRQYKMTEDYTGLTKKGFNIPIELLPELIATLKFIENKCHDTGLTYLEEDDE